MSKMIFENDEICLTGVRLVVDYDYIPGTPRTWNYPGDPEEVEIHSVTMTLGDEVRDLTAFLHGELEQSFKDDILDRLHSMKEDVAA